MSEDDLIQTIATAIYTASGPNARARAVLTAINEAGYAVVPREPSEEQTKAIMTNVGFPVRAYRAAITTGETGQ